ncbi:hypothetical protein NHX12_016968, partial [Muraenolepis orangiensis]
MSKVQGGALLLLWVLLHLGPVRPGPAGPRLVGPGPAGPGLTDWSHGLVWMLDATEQ